MTKQHNIDLDTLRCRISPKIEHLINRGSQKKKIKKVIPVELRTFHKF